jgi:predicted transposase YbfD/YdcC
LDINGGQKKQKFIEHKIGDEQRKRANHTNENFAIVRKIALNLLKKRPQVRL